MALYVDGNLVRAGDLRRRAFPQVGLMDSDFVLISTATLTPVTGLLVYLAASRAYALDGYIAYQVASTIDVGLTLEAGTATEVAGSWSIPGIDNIDVNPGSLDAAHVSDFTGTTPFYLAGDTEPLSAVINGAIFTGRNPAVLQINATQGVSDAGTLTIKAGSWIRAMVIE